MEYVLKKTETGKKITVRMLQNKLLEMMKDIDKICQKNDINYFFKFLKNYLFLTIRFNAF